MYSPTPRDLTNRVHSVSQSTRRLPNWIIHSFRSVLSRRACYRRIAVNIDNSNQVRTRSSASSEIRSKSLTSTSSLLSILHLHPTPMQRIQPPLEYWSLQRTPIWINSPTLRFENGYCERYVLAGELGPGYFGVEVDFCFPEVGGVGLDV